LKACLVSLLSYFTPATASTLAQMPLARLEASQQPQRSAKCLERCNNNAPPKLSADRRLGRVRVANPVQPRANMPRGAGARHRLPHGRPAESSFTFSSFVHNAGHVRFRPVLKGRGGPLRRAEPRTARASAAAAGRCGRRVEEVRDEGALARGRRRAAERCVKGGGGWKVLMFRRANRRHRAGVLRRASSSSISGGCGDVGPDDAEDGARLVREAR
jgi:hypothetical protein